MAAINGMRVIVNVINLGYVTERRGGNFVAVPMPLTVMQRRDEHDDSIVSVTHGSGDQYGISDAAPSRARVPLRPHVRVRPVSLPGARVQAHALRAPLRRFTRSRRWWRS